MSCIDCDKTPLRLEKAQVLSNECIAPDVYLMAITAPWCAAEVKPGQFVNLRLPKNQAEILRLPFSVYGVIPSLGAIEIVYQVLGNGTKHMTTLGIGEMLDVVGPIGHGWSVESKVSRALLVSGGLGAAPLTMLAQEFHARGIETDIVMGAPSENRLVCRDRLEKCGSVEVATDDGTCGVEGFCTMISSAKLQEGGYDYVATCGPEPMQKIVAAQAIQAGVHCEVSLERLMACGIGVCLSCVVDTKQGKKRACVDGPVFDASEVCW